MVTKIKTQEAKLSKVIKDIETKEEYVKQVQFEMKQIDEGVDPDKILHRKYTRETSQTFRVRSKQRFEESSEQSFEDKAGKSMSRLEMNNISRGAFPVLND